MSFKKSFYAGIFLIAAATLLLEITLTKVFSIIHYHHLAFMIVSTALFGYGFSGVYLSVAGWVSRISPRRLVFFSTLLFSLTMIAAYWLILQTPLDLSVILSSKTQLLYLGKVYLLLAFPFFFSGLAVGALLTFYPERINRLYFADLTGAGLGCFAIVLIIPVAGGSGTILIAAALAAVAAIVFAEKWVWVLLPIAIVGVVAYWMPNSDDLFPTTLHSEKRYFHDSIAKGTRVYTGWSPASRIDVVRIGPQFAVIWIDGGTNQSIMRKWHDWESIPAPTNKAVTPEQLGKTIELPYALVKNPDVLIIGSGGGVEVNSALDYHPRSITAVELDPQICKIVTGQFAPYIGGIYTFPGVRLINEEGRSFVRRSSQKFDIIQQKNNSHPMAVASGALNLSETYLLTKEAFEEYIDHLNPNGFISIERHGGTRLLNLAAEVWKDRGVTDAWKRLVLVGENPLNQVFLLKNGDFTGAELKIIRKYVAINSTPKILYSPDMYENTDNLFTRLMNEKTREQVIHDAPFRLEAPTDDKPFMEHFFKMQTLFSSDIQRKLDDPYWDPAALSQFCEGDTRFSDLSLYIILIEALFLSTAFIILPLVKMRREGISAKGTWHWLAYFFALGLGFIFIEIAFIQKYILFIGYPVYSVAAIIFALLIAAGAGSYFSGRFKNPLAGLKTVMIVIAVLILIQMFLVPILFRQLLYLSFTMRMILSIAFIMPVGFFMGMPFPIGLSWVSKRAGKFVPWAWGMNGYATVIGSVLSVILALNFGFRVVLLTAAIIYGLAYLALKTAPTTE